MKRILLFLALLALAFVAAPTLWAVDAPKDPVKMMMPEGAKVTKPPVMFPHAKHGALDCKTCHHTWDGEAEIAKCKSSGCHDDVTTKKGERSYYLTYHKTSDISCLGCHKKLKKEGADKYGPFVCKECHKEENK